jgi:hypothetical protein
MCDFELHDIDDGHKPGKTRRGTKLAVNRKATEKFVAVFDDLLPQEWQCRGYELAAQRVKPWGT